MCVIKNLAAWLLMLVAAMTVKHHFSGADPADLAWILAPTAALVEGVTGLVFAPDPALGYVCPQARVIIAPACSGINFLIIAFAVTAIAGLARFRSLRAKAAWLIASAAIGYGATLAANTGRIVTAIWLNHADFYSAWASADSAHRMLGILIYLPGLYLIHHLAQRLVRTLAPTAVCCAQRPRVFPNPLPLIVYGVVLLLVPLLNDAGRIADPLFISHALAVTGGALFIYALIAGIRLSFFMIGRRTSRQLSHIAKPAGKLAW